MMDNTNDSHLGIGDHPMSPLIAEAIEKRNRLARFNEHDHCHADSDGDCNYPDCPQIKDGEPQKTGRHCPLDNKSRDEEV